MSALTLDAERKLDSAVNILGFVVRHCPDADFLTTDGIQEIKEAKESFFTEIGNLEKEKYRLVSGNATLVLNAKKVSADRNALKNALFALGAMPGGYCFCRKDRDPYKSDHTGECASARAALNVA